jgi:hypothetical protein
MTEEGAMARVAIVMTVKNERDMLRSNILFHRCMGVERFYLFLDETTDRTGETLTDLDYVEVAESMSAGRFLSSKAHRDLTGRSSRLARAVEESEHQHTARQILNTVVGLEGARERGIEWLIGIDADELVCPRIEEAERGEIGAFFGAFDGRTEQVRLRPLEIVQQNKHYRNVFAEGVLFKRPGSGVGRPVYDPLAEKIQRFERRTGRFWRFRFPKFRRFDWWYGHHEGKCAVRVDRDIVPLVHRFEALDGHDLVSEERGYLLHYFMYNVEDFIKKYRNYEKQPDKWLYGTAIPYRKKLWRDLVNNPSFSEDYVGDYFARWIAFSEEEISRLQELNHSRIISVQAVREMFERELGGGLVVR